jgi:hypothetical protein
MLNPIRAAALAVACLAVAGCTGQPGTSKIDAAVKSANTVAISVSPKLATVEAKISAALVKACGWQPTVSTAASLAASLSGSATVANLTSVVNQLAEATCLVVQSPENSGVGLLDRAPVPTYRGVPLVGRFVR